jgi:hypothetical protein
MPWSRYSLIASLLFVGCGGDQQSKTAVTKPAANLNRPAPVPPPKTDPEQVKAAAVSVLYLGNSHTGHHDVPGLVGRMIAYRQPKKKYYQRYLGVGFLEDASRDPELKAEIERHPWKFVVLQAQKISSSGKYRYSQKDGIELAKAAKTKGAQAYFFSEWGRRDVPDDGVVQESIYQEMADAAGVRVAPVGRAWDVALARKPSLPLYDGDGNHESAVGAFLTACVFYGLLADSDPAELAFFEYEDLSEEDREIMANAASKVWKEEKAKHAKP